MSMHTLHRQGPRKPSCCTAFMLNAHCCHGPKINKQKSCINACRVTLVMSNSLQPYRLWPTRPLCQGVLQARILENIGQYWLPYPSRALDFLLPQPPTPLSTWCCQNLCYSSSCTTSAPGPQRGKPKLFSVASGANPSGRPKCRGGNKTTVETLGQCG